jgi:hypothetical protein
LRRSDSNADLLLPDHFWNVSYNGRRLPGAPGNAELTGGANCQTFAYAVLRHFGRSIPELRSSELWHDREHTFVVTAWEPLDLILFNRSHEAFGAHVGVFIGDRILHLCKSKGRPALWDISQFAERREYRVLIGAKRARH